MTTHGRTARRLPADSRFLARHVQTPLIEPGTFQELKDWINAAFKISAAANLYVCYLTTENQASGGGNVELHPNIYPEISDLKQINLDTQLIDADKRVILPPHTAQIEVEALRKRIPSALETARNLETQQNSVHGRNLKSGKSTVSDLSVRA